MCICVCSPTYTTMTLVWGLGIGNHQDAGTQKVHTTELQLGPTATSLSFFPHSSFAQHFPKAYNFYPNLLTLLGSQWSHFSVIF